MPTPLQQVLINVGERLDEDLLPLLYQAASLRHDQIRQEFYDGGMAFCDGQKIPPQDELDATVDRIISRSVRQATVRGTVAGMGGAVAIPPELIAALVQSIHLAQRLMVVHGMNPETDRGKVTLTRALAAAYEVEIPEQTSWALRTHQLGDVMRNQLPDKQRTAAWLMRSFASRLAASITGRAFRVIPVIGGVIGGYDARRRIRDQGRRMNSFLARVSDANSWAGGNCEDAIEVEGSH